ncbi:MAG: coniferyl-aldehyde dehydrogenase [Chlamydiales bacterium]|jgi:coniferyl-aldehyde dehydrogenase
MTTLTEDFRVTGQTLATSFSEQKAAFRRENISSLTKRKDDLKKLHRALLKNQDKLAIAISDDFGQRSPYETKILELFPCVEAVKYALKNLKKWMSTEKKSLSIWFKLAKAQVVYQPLGIVGIIVPWNYPLFLAIEPLVGALAAGNHVMIKMSENSPKATTVLREILAEIFPKNQVAVISGGRGVGTEFSSLPFDHMLFTGSTEVGKNVMQAASANLTPVTLELGGRCPAIIGRDANLSLTVERLMMSKLLNAGQSCVAPSYVMIPSGLEDRFFSLCKDFVASRYSHFNKNKDYTSLATRSQYERLKYYLEDAVDKDAKVIPLGPSKEKPCEISRIMPPYLLHHCHDEMLVMQEEIFGPILPVISYDTLGEAIQYINDRPHPLALYYFSNKQSDIDRVNRQTLSGGLSINETLVHAVQDSLPFGGVGPSGMGQYHGRDGFETFSKKKGVFIQSKFSALNLLHPPFGPLTKFFLKFMLR